MVRYKQQRYLFRGMMWYRVWSLRCRIDSAFDGAAQLGAIFDVNLDKFIELVDDILLIEWHTVSKFRPHHRVLDKWIDKRAGIEILKT